MEIIFARSGVFIRYPLVVLLVLVGFGLGLFHLGCSGQPTNLNDGSVSVTNTNETPRPYPLPNRNPQIAAEWQMHYPKVLGELERQEAIWNQKRPASYRFSCQRYAGGVRGWGKVDIEVRQEQIPKINRSKGQDPIVNIEGYEEFATVERVFSIIRKRVLEGNFVDVSFNKEYGFPSEASWAVKYMIDSNESFQITEFRVLQ